MKFSGIFLTAFISQAAAFSSPKASTPRTSRYAGATMEADTEEKVVTDAPVLGKEPITSSMDVDKDWPVEDFVKDSDRVLP